MMQFRYYVEVAESLNISAAARKCFISQQAMSDQMSRLERHYGVPLFLRDRRGRISGLTGIGRQLYAMASEAVRLEDGFIRSCNVLSAGIHDQIRLGLTPTFTRLLMSDIINGFHQAFPEVNLSVVTDGFISLAEKLSQNQLDIVLGTDFNKALKGYDSFPVAKSQVYAVLRRDLIDKYYSGRRPAVLTPFRTEISVEVFRDAPVLIPSVGNITELVMRKVFEKNGLRPNILMQANTGDLLIHMAKSGMGLTYVLKHVVMESISEFTESAGEILAFPLSSRDVQLELSLFCAPRIASNEAIISLAGTVRTSYSAHTENLPGGNPVFLS